MTTETTTETVAAYLRRIRNQAKRNYAYAAWHAIVSGQEMPDRGGLSFMGAQSVDMELRHFDPASGKRIDVMRGTCKLCAVMPGYDHAANCPNRKVTPAEANVAYGNLLGAEALATLTQWNQPAWLSALTQTELYELNCRVGRAYLAAHRAQKWELRDELFGTLCADVLPLVVV